METADPQNTAIVYAIDTLTNQTYLNGQVLQATFTLVIFLLAAALAFAVVHFIARGVQQ